MQALHEDDVDADGADVVIDLDAGGVEEDDEGAASEEEEGGDEQVRLQEPASAFGLSFCLSLFIS